MILSGDESLREWIHARLDQQAIRTLEEIRQRLQDKLPEPIGFWINRKRLQAVDEILEKVFHQLTPNGGHSYRLLNTLTTHPIAGVPILLLVLCAVYKFVGDLGAGIAVDFMQQEVFGRWINPAALRGVQSLGLWKPLEDFLVGPYGMIPMGLTYALAIVMPIVATFFLAFGLLEDSGYLPRLAIMANRVFRVMGLNGKAVLPMVLGLGCGTMATLTARMLETKKERVLVTLLLALGIPCSAQIGVMAGMFAGMAFKAVLIWLGVVVGSMILVGLLASRVLPGEKGDFLLEIPPLRVPTLKNLLMKTLARMEWFLMGGRSSFSFRDRFLICSRSTQPSPPSAKMGGTDRHRVFGAAGESDRGFSPRISAERLRSGGALRLGPGREAGRNADRRESRNPHAVYSLSSQFFYDYQGAGMGTGVGHGRIHFSFCHPRRRSLEFFSARLGDFPVTPTPGEKIRCPSLRPPLFRGRNKDAEENAVSSGTAESSVAPAAATPLSPNPRRSDILKNLFSRKKEKEPKP